MSHRAFFLVTGVLFLLIGLLHLWRILGTWEAVIGGIAIPPWASYIAVVLAAFISYNGFRLGRKA